METERLPLKRKPAMQDLLFGLFLICLAGIVFWATRRLPVGNAASMGPGYFPRVLAWGTLCFGGFFIGKSLTYTGEPILSPRWRPLILIPMAAAIFSLLLQPGGLALASFLSMLVASAASEETRPAEIVIFSLAISAGSVLLFVRALSLPVPIFPW